MDLVAEALFDRLRAEHAERIDVRWIRPPLRRRFTCRDGPMGRTGMSKTRFNADRLLNRFVDYPRLLARMRPDVDLFHIIDHSYAHLAAAVTPSRAVVTCHDLDAFRPLLGHPARSPSLMLRKMAGRQLRGLQCAAIVACASDATRAELLHHRLVEAGRTATIHNGVAPIFRAKPDAAADQHAASLLGPASPASLELLHVGSTIPRKRIELLLRIFAGIRKAAPAARLIRAGGPFTPAQAALARELAIDDAIAVLPFVQPATLAAIYRRAALVLIPSEHEGFGLPLVEAIACGTPVIASDIPALREVGGAAAEFVAVAADASGWIDRALGLLAERAGAPGCRDARCAAGLVQAAKFSWSEYARRYADLYRRAVST